MKAETFLIIIMIVLSIALIALTIRLEYSNEDKLQCIINNAKESIVIIDSKCGEIL